MERGRLLGRRNQERGESPARCLVAGCLSVTVLYVFINLAYAYAYALSPSLVQQLPSEDRNRIAYVAMNYLFGATTANTFSLLVSIGVLACLSAYILLGPRVWFAMAADGLVPNIAHRLHPTRGVPVVATVFQAGLALALLWSGTFEQILNFASYGLAANSLLVVAPIFVLRSRSSFRPLVRVPFYPWTPMLFIFANLCTLVGSAIEQPGLAALSLLSIFTGFPVYFLIKRFL